MFTQTSYGLTFQRIGLTWPLDSNGDDAGASVEEDCGNGKNEQKAV